MYIYIYIYTCIGAHSQLPAVRGRLSHRDLGAAGSDPPRLICKGTRPLKAEANPQDTVSNHI